MATASSPVLEVPVGATTAFAQAINSGDLPAAADCFTRDACLLTPDSTIVQGRPQITSILRQLIAVGWQIEIQETFLIPAGEVALTTQRWQVTSVAPEGQTFSRILTPTVVLRRVDGAWKLAVAMPWHTNHAT